MSSLSAHLRQPDGHAALAFHSACPVCRRERVAGSLPADALMPRRTQAALVAGMLAFSAGGAPVAVAADPDQTSEGTAAPDLAAGDDPALRPDFDPGGDSTDLPFDAPPTTEQPAPPDPDSDDVAPLEPEPMTDRDVPVADPGDNADLPTPHPSAQPSPPPPDAAASPDAAATPQPAPAAPAPTAPTTPETETPVPDSEAPDPDTAAQARPRNPKPQPSAEAHAQHPRSPEPTPQPAAAEPAPTATAGVATPVAGHAATQQTPVLVEAGAASGRARPGDRSHVVMPGESLWSIAADLLGRDASPARIAREVNRLWALNEQRIATGDRDLILIGTRLRLQ